MQKCTGKVCDGHQLQLRISEDQLNKLNIQLSLPALAL